MPTNNPYAIDLGNGFTKRTKGNDVIVEPSVIEYIEDFFTSKESGNTFKYEKSDSYRIGNDADPSRAESALGEEDQERYFTNEFSELLYGFIAKDFKEDVTIPLVVTGLPVNHYNEVAQRLVDEIKGKKVIRVNNNDAYAEIIDCRIIPQPLGTYMYLVNKGVIDPEEDSVLIVDGGHGTLDITEINDFVISKKAGAELGVKEAHLQIFDFLNNKYSGSKHLKIANIHNILEKGLLYNGSKIDVKNLQEVKKIINRHFDKQSKFVKDSGFNVSDYTKVIYTGGSAELHREVIEEKQKKNFYVVENAQEANVLGYLEYGKAVLESEKDSTVR